MNNQYTWIPFYMELADKLKDYVDNRQSLIEKITIAFSGVDNLPKLDENTVPTDIDPFTVLSIFNKSGEDKRKQKAERFAEIFRIQASVPMDFNGIPVRSTSYAFYGFGNDRRANDIDNLWKLFIVALDYADKKTSKTEFCNIFNTVIRQKQVRLSSLTMGLFWIRPYVFLNFDSVNQPFLRNSQYSPKAVVDVINQKMIKKTRYNDLPDAEVYLEVCEICLEALKLSDYEYKDFPSLSYFAWKTQKGTDISSDGSEWFPSLDEYTPNLSVEDWHSLLENSAVFDENSLAVIKAFYDIGGQATCSELAQKYGNNAMHYSGIVTGLAKRINKATDCPLVEDDKNENAKWWPILFIGKYADKQQQGVYIWKLRDELKTALNIEFIGNQTASTITRCWFVGAYNDSDDTHQDEEFIEQGIWQNGYTDKFLDTVNSVKVGDKIAIKTSYTKKKGLPFDNKGSTISVMKIKIVGTVTANHMDGRTLEVDWDTTFKPKEWYFYTFRNTITLPKVDDWRTKALYDFLFNDTPQNYDLFSAKDQPMKIYEAIALVLESNDRSMNIDEIYDAIVAENLYQFDAKDRERKGKVDTALKRHCLGVDISEKSNNILFYISNVNDGTNYYSLIKNKNDQGNDLLPPSNSEFLKYFSPLIQALKDLGGSATRKETHEKVIELMDITEEELNVTYEKTGVSRVLNQIDFARNDLAHEGFISNGTKGVWALTELGMNTDMTMELAGLIHMKWVKINMAKRKGEPIPEIDLSKYYKKKIDHKYTKKDFLNDVFITETEYDKLCSLVLRKKNIILQGAPGVGKTFSAKRLAYSIIGEENENRICMVQFHQNYSYEDFIMGYRPNDSGGFELQSGAFFNFCERCKENPGKPYFFIIDEINRGNLSKIFGELLMLIETDKRGEKHKMNLVYGGTGFYIPDNLHIIGMMNTADRSLAMIDYALRRRFSFYTMQPAFDNADQNGFGKYMNDVKNSKLYPKTIEAIKKLNETIRDELGKGFEIGHSYFSPEDPTIIDDSWVRNVIEYEIIPLIEEYWFDNDETLSEETNKLLQAIGDSNDS